MEVGSRLGADVSIHLLLLAWSQGPSQDGAAAGEKRAGWDRGEENGKGVGEGGEAMPAARERPSSGRGERKRRVASISGGAYSGRGGAEADEDDGGGVGVDSMH